jgi:hypothetical protein
MGLFKSKLDENLEELESTPEGKEALENALAAWESNHGEMPSDQEMQSITTLVRRQQSTTHHIMTNVGIIIFILAIAVQCASSFMHRGFYYY